MTIMEFPEQTAVYAKEQPQYLPLPAFQFGDSEGRIACCWKLSWWERLYLLWTGYIWHEILTFDDTLQPQKLSIYKPVMKRQGTS